MATINVEKFKEESLAAGFEEVLERKWDANTEIDTHTHPFSVQALVTQGEMWFTCGGTTSHLTPGSTFKLERDAPHSEKYGAQGATFWVARKYN
jgi:hypothetical protein